MKNLDVFKWLAIALIYITLFTLIGFAVYYTNSAKPLWALIVVGMIPVKRFMKCGKKKKDIVNDNDQKVIE